MASTRNVRIDKQAPPVFGKSGFPWRCSDYRGPRQPQFKLATALQAVAEHFNLAIHENYTRREIGDIVEAIRKVAGAYRAAGSRG